MQEWQAKWLKRVVRSGWIAGLLFNLWFVPHASVVAAPSPPPIFNAPLYRYFDYSRADWGANPLYDGRLKLYANNNAPFTVSSTDLDSGKIFHPLIQPGQLIALPDLPQLPTGITIHDTVTPNDPGCNLANSIATLRSIQTYHATAEFIHISYGPSQPDPAFEYDNRGLPDATLGDVGYHFLIDCAGRVFEGRAGGVLYQGRHVHRHNRGQIGIALLGTFDKTVPSQAQQAALVRLVTRLCQNFGIGPEAQWQQLLLDNTLKPVFKNHQLVLRVAGHVDFPDNDHLDPQSLNLSLLRQAVVSGLTSPARQNFGETSLTLAEPFLSFWQANGGLAIFGLPISPVHEEFNSSEKKSYQVQYFERARFELHSELVGTPYYVLLGQLGTTVARHFQPNYPTAFQPIPKPETSPANSLYFSETSHSLSANFLAYWQAHGGLFIFGLPLSQEFSELDEQGQVHLVQYFERARFEYHPEAPPAYQVLLGRLGAVVYPPRN